MMSFISFWCPVIQAILSVIACVSLAFMGNYKMALFFFGGFVVQIASVLLVLP